MKPVFPRLACRQATQRCPGISANLIGLQVGNSSPFRRCLPSDVLVDVDCRLCCTYLLLILAEFFHEPEVGGDDVPATADQEKGIVESELVVSHEVCDDHRSAPH